MAPKTISTQLTDTSHFEIRPGTRLIIRFDERQTKLHQECTVTRRDRNVVTGTLREYGGDRFRIRIRLTDKVAVLSSPDLSWLPDPEDIVLGVVTRIAEMIHTRRLRGSTVTRRTENL